MTDDDLDIADYIENLPRHLTFSQLADACQRQFGARAWSRSRIVGYWEKNHPARTGRPSRLERDGAVRAFVEDRLGRISLDELLVACQNQFGPSRTPSRSSLHLHWMKLRQGKLR